MRRKLSKKEEERLSNFNILCEKLEREGYKKEKLLVSLLKANVYSIIFMIPLALLFIFISFLINKKVVLRYDGDLLVLIYAYLVVILLVIIHEAIHGLTWAHFSKNKMKDIEFGVIKWVAVYATCKSVLKRKEYLLGALMPLVITGIIPSIIGFILNNGVIIIIGYLLIVGAFGDLMIVQKVLSFKNNDKDNLYIDHPTEGGCVVFYK